jgi:excisionase family DNA binding protein
VRGTGAAAAGVAMTDAPPPLIPPPPGLYTIAEVAEALRVSRWTVMRAIDAGELRAVRLGRLTRIRAADLEDYVPAHRDRRPL